MQKTKVVQGCDLYLPIMIIQVWGKIGWSENSSLNSQF
jgi:hypothetical protein